MTTASSLGDGLSPDEIQWLLGAARYLENPSLLMQMANAVGKPLALVVKAADKVVPGRVDEAVSTALRTALNLALRTIPAGSGPTARVGSEGIDETPSTSGFFHMLSVALTGSVGGLFGFAGLALELPITTTIMFRSIATIAQKAEEDIDDADVQLQCLTVFCLGGPGTSDDALDGAYLAARFGLQEAVTHAARSVAGLGARELAALLQAGSAPALVNLIAKVAARFNVTVTQKMLVQSLPVVGAAAGATINVAFMEHFNRVARFHFGIRKLERKYGAQLVQDAYRNAVRRTRDNIAAR